MANWEEAYVDWQSGMKYKQIAEKYGVTESAIKSWTQRYFKPKKECEEAKKVATKRGNDAGGRCDGSQVKPAKKSGAPKGNKNALGNHGGAPKGNSNNLKHGLYSGVYWDTLTDEERQMLQEMDWDDEEAMLKDQIRLLTVREHRLIKTIEEWKQKKGGITLDSVVKRDLTISGNFLNSNVTEQTQTETTTKTTATADVITKLESELTRVQGKKTKAIESLAKLRMERARLEDEGHSEMVDDWIISVVGGEADG